MSKLIFLVLSQDDYDHSYSEHKIHCVSVDEDQACRVYDMVDRSKCAGLTLLQVDSSVSLSTPYELFGHASTKHPDVKVIREWMWWHNNA